MIQPSRARHLHALTTTTTTPISLTLPIRLSRRQFSTTHPLTSNIGRAPLTLPTGVTLDILPPILPKGGKRQVGRTAPSPSVQITGPLGQLSMIIPSFIRIELDEVARKANVRIENRSERQQREMWGTTRAYLANHITGVSEGHTTLLRMVGVGYRATIESTATTTTSTYLGQKFVSLKVGYSHPIELGIPQGVTASTPQPTRILLEGSEKEVLKSFAAKIRKWRVPEPYKGKGIFVDGETIKLKAKKIK